MNLHLLKKKRQLPNTKGMNLYDALLLPLQQVKDVRIGHIIGTEDVTYINNYY